MDYQVQLSFENINAPELGVYGVDHVAVAERLGLQGDPCHRPEGCAGRRLQPRAN